MGYAQWVTIKVVNESRVALKLDNLKLSWGKLYGGDKDHEKSPGDYNGRIIKSGASLELSSCGRSDAASGTEGSFTLYDVEAGDAEVREVYWDCPWGSKTNTFTVGGDNNKWIVEASGANLYGGALGNVTIDLYKKGSA